MAKIDVRFPSASFNEAATEDGAAEELRAFETGALDPRKFPHAEHIRLGYEMLCRHSFGDTIDRFCRGLKLLTAKAGQPQVYHETITVAFLALINERRLRDGSRDWQHFREMNPDLFDKRALEHWYSGEQLASKLARRAFCLPSRSGGLQTAVLKAGGLETAAP